MKLWNIVSVAAVFAAVVGIRLGTKPTWASADQKKRGGEAQNY